MTKPKKLVKRGKAGVSQASAAERRNLFAEAYLSNGGNALNAALAAGFSEKSAQSQGSRLLRNAKVRAILDSKLAETFSELKITRERILQERARLAFFDPRKLFDKDGQPIPIQDLDDDTAAALCGLDISQQSTGGEDPITTTTKKYKLADKNASLTSLERQFGMNVPKEPDDDESKRVSRDLIESARAIAFTLARASKLLGKT